MSRAGTVGTEMTIAQVTERDRTIARFFRKVPVEEEEADAKRSGKNRLAAQAHLRMLSNSLQVGSGQGFSKYGPEVFEKHLITSG